MTTDGWTQNDTKSSNWSFEQRLTIMKNDQYTFTSPSVVPHIKCCLGICNICTPLFMQLQTISDRQTVP